MNQQKAAFFEQYAPLAMAQQQKYGIPASITLAQMYIESAGGKSNLARNGNNFFGIKCTSDWLAAGKPYSLHNDDRPNEKFCNYSSVEESIEHHSKFLMGKRYARCRQCGSDDYRGWANGLRAAGYATNPNYAKMLISEIEAYGLTKYDQQAKTMPVSADAKVNRSTAMGKQEPVLTPTQQQNAQQGALLAQQTGSNDPKTMLAYLMGQNQAEQYADTHQDLFSSLISGLFMSAIGMAAMLDQADRHSGNDQPITQQQQPKEESEQQKVATLIQRKRDSVDPEQARATAMMNFDAEYPERLRVGEQSEGMQQQGNGQRLA